MRNTTTMQLLDKHRPEPTHHRPHTTVAVAPAAWLLWHRHRSPRALASSGTHNGNAVPFGSKSHVQAGFNKWLQLSHRWNDVKLRVAGAAQSMRCTAPCAQAVMANNTVIRAATRRKPALSTMNELQSCSHVKCMPTTTSPSPLPLRPPTPRHTPTPSDSLSHP